MGWGRACSERVYPLFKGEVDPRLDQALQVAEAWEKGKVKTGVAMKASLGAHAVARESSDPTSIAVARSIGQAVAAAHMADHCIGAALYALKAVKHARKSIPVEREWQVGQLQQLPPEIVDLVLTTFKTKEVSFKL